MHHFLVFTEGWKMTSEKDDALTLQIRRAGENIMVLRQLKGLNRSELANAAELSRSAITEIEQGLTSPTTKTIFKLAMALEVKSHHFFYCCDKTVSRGQLYKEYGKLFD